MKKSKFTQEQIASALRQAERGIPVEEICRNTGVSEATFHSWKRMYGGLSEYLKQEVDLPEDLIRILEPRFDRLEIPKGEELLSAGSRSKKVFFVEKGLLRLYYIKDGKDITRHFLSENAFYTPIENVFLQVPYPYNIEALENSVVRTVDYAVVEEHLDTDLRLQRFARYLLTSAIKLLSDHLYSIQFQSAQERYRILLKTNPDILLRAPLGNIASFLGITQQTLSVIRAEMAK